MEFLELVKKARSCRRFNQDRVITMEELERLADMARHVPSAANKQPLRYVLVNDPTTCGAVYATLGWAAYLPRWAGPEEGEKPAAYIVILGNEAEAADLKADLGIAIQTMFLGARAMGLGGCMFGSINRDKLAQALELGPDRDILLVLALGEPVEECVVETVGDDDNIKYWRDDAGVHHVPKRALDELVVKRFPA